MRRLISALTSEAALATAIIGFAVVIGFAVWQNSNRISERERIDRLEHPTQAQQLRRLDAAIRTCVRSKRCRDSLLEIIETARRDGARHRRDATDQSRRSRGRVGGSSSGRDRPATDPPGPGATGRPGPNPSPAPGGRDTSPPATGDPSHPPAPATPPPSSPPCCASPPIAITAPIAMPICLGPVAVNCP